MKVAITTDTHYGARKGSKLFHDYFEKFYDDVFFPTLDKEGIEHVIHMGDVFDSRKGIEFKSLEWAKRVVFDRLRERCISTHMMVGNHDAYYKNTNDVNAVQLLLQEYVNIQKFSKATEVEIDGLKILYVPWICEDNQEETFKIIKNTSSSVVMGHLELNGFAAYPGHIMETGISSDIFSRFKKVFSGHYHTRSDNGKIYYLGNPYEMFWSDLEDKRGFTIFDTETLKTTPIDNPYRLFYKVTYEDTKRQIFNYKEYKNKIVKVVVRKKSDDLEFEKFIDGFYNAGVSDLKIVENFDYNNGWIHAEETEELESEDTLSILTRYIDQSEVSLEKETIKKILREVYQESCEIV